MQLLIVGHGRMGRLVEALAPDYGFEVAGALEIDSNADGAGVTADNVADIINRSGVREVHLSGKTARPSRMETSSCRAHMGSDGVDDFSIPVTSAEKIAAVVRAVS